MEALQKATTTRRAITDTVAREDITETMAREVKLKGEITSELKTMRHEIVGEAREYIDKIIEELKSTMSTLEIALCSSMKAL